MSNKKDALDISPKGPKATSWWHRLIHRKCWYCNVPLRSVSARDGCPLCLSDAETCVFLNGHKKKRDV